MRVALLLITGSCLHAFGTWAQTTEQQVKDIRSWYASVEAKLKDCQKVKMNDWVDDTQYSGYTPETVGYYDQAAGQFIKFTETGGGDWHEETAAYYLKDAKVFFVFTHGYVPGEMYTAEEMGMSEQELHESGGEAKTLEVYEDRVYIAEGKVIQHLTKNKEVPVEEEMKLADLKSQDGERTGKPSANFDWHVKKVLEQLNSRRAKK